ncbi:MAG: glycosyltransferase, partial [Chthoniobacteraceae bacterium]
MTGPPPSPSAIIALCLGAAGAVLHVIAAIRLRGHFRRASPSQPGELPPLTLWRTVKPGVPELARKLDALVAASRTDDQILIGADSGSPELAACEALRARHPERAIVVVACEPDRAANPKISKFIQMTPFAVHECWLLTDSEAMLDAEFVAGFRAEWAASGADAQTAGYRFTGLRTGAQILDAAPPLLTLWPGLMLAGRIRFTLGACNGVKAADIRAIGGWEVLADELAEDHRLGALLAGAGKRIRLSRHVVTLDSDPPDWSAFARHQHRAAVTYRAAAPAGTLGLPLLHTPVLAAAITLLHPAWWK